PGAVRARPDSRGDRTRCGPVLSGNVGGADLGRTYRRSPQLCEPRQRHHAAGLAAVLSPAAFGVISDLTGSYRLPFLASIALLAVGLGLPFAMRPARGVIGAAPPPPATRMMPSRLEVPL